jgi:hypothetical protein
MRSRFASRRRAPLALAVAVVSANAPSFEQDGDLGARYET